MLLKLPVSWLQKNHVLICWPEERDGLSLPIVKRTDFSNFFELEKGQPIFIKSSIVLVFYA